MVNSGDVLIFAEDPGAANYVANIPAELSKIGVRTTLFADGLARKYFKNNCISYQDVNLINPEELLSSEFKYKLVLLGTSENEESFGFKLLTLARINNIPTVAVVDASMNEKYRFKGTSDNSLEHVPDWLVVTDKWTKDKYRELGFSENRIVVLGHPHYDKITSILSEYDCIGCNEMRNRVIGNHNIGNRKLVVFISEGSENNAKWDTQRMSGNYTLKGWGRSAGRTEIVLEEVISSIQAMREDVYFVLRLHPKDKMEEYIIYKDHIDCFSYDDNPLELVYSSDLVVGLTSMLLTEAILLKKRVLSVVPRRTEGLWLPSVRNGDTECVYTRDKLKNAIKKHIYCDIGDHKTSINNNNFVVGDSMSTMIEFINMLV